MKVVDIKEFEKDMDTLMNAAFDEGLVLLTLGKPSHVLISAEQYDILLGFGNG